jgi:hypothetical protein
MGNPPPEQRNSGLLAVSNQLNYFMKRIPMFNVSAVALTTMATVVSLYAACPNTAPSDSDKQCASNDCSTVTPDSAHVCGQALETTKFPDGTKTSTGQKTNQENTNCSRTAVCKFDMGTEKCVLDYGTGNYSQSLMYKPAVACTQ